MYDQPAPQPAPGPLQRMMQALAVSAQAFRLPHRPIDWILPLVILTVVQTASGFLLADLMVADQMERTRTAMEENPNLSAEQREEQLERMSSGSLGTVMRYSTIGSMVVMPAVGALITAAVLLLILNFGMGGAAQFKNLWFFACLSAVPSIVRAILHTVLALARSTTNIAFGPAAFVSPDNLQLHTFLQAFDLFFIWVFVIQYVGITQVSGLPDKKSKTAIVILAVITVVFMALMALAAGCGRR